MHFLLLFPMCIYIFFNVSIKIWCFWNSLEREIISSSARRAGGANRTTSWCMLGWTPSLRDCLVQQVHHPCCSLQSITLLFKVSATRGSRFLFLCFAIKCLWSEILSSEVRSILHRPPIIITEWWFSITEFNRWLKNDRFHFPLLLTQPATSWCGMPIFKIFPRFTVFSLFTIQSNSRVYSA